MRSIASMSVVVAAVLMVAAAQEKSDVEKFLGAWTTASLVEDGKAAPEGALRTIKTLFKDGGTYQQVVRGNVVEEGAVTLDPKASPKTLTFAIKTGPDKGKDQVGIYELDGDNLKISLAKAGVKDRPSNFESKEGSKVLVVVLRREPK